MLDWLDARYGIVLGRMQPLHVGHLEYLDAARVRCGRLVIGVTSPDIADLVDDPADPGRSRQDHNPFSYFSRAEMITGSLLDQGWTSVDFIVVPADVNRPATLRATLPPPEIATVFITVYDEWGDRKSQLLKDLGYEVEVLWRRTMNDRITSGTEIRLAMRNGSAWKHLVPDAVARFLTQTGMTASPPMLAGSHLSTNGEQ
jgi:cytidyltransferase-like protein